MDAAVAITNTGRRKLLHISQQKGNLPMRLGERSHTVYRNKKCDGCEYVMRRVVAQTRYCRQCVSRLCAARNAEPANQAKMAVGRFNWACAAVAAAVDQELAAPTRYWDM